MSAGKAYRGLPMEGPIASWYARITAGDTGHRAAAEQVARKLHDGASVLEVAPGPGYVSIELARLGRFRVVGLDISASFVRIAGDNAARAGVKVEFRQGNASAMPFGDGEFDFVVCKAAFKNFSDPAGALREMRRVLKTGGRALVLDLRKDITDLEIEEYVRDMQLGVLSAAMTRWIFRNMLRPRAYPEAELRALAARAFHEVEVEKQGLGCGVWLG